VRLEKKLAFETPAAITDDTLGHRALEPERIPHGKHNITGVNVITTTQNHVTRFQVSRERKLEEGQVDERIQCDNLHILHAAPTESSRNIDAQYDRNPALTLNHVIVGDRVTFLVDQEARTLAGWSLDRDDRLTELADQFLDWRWFEHTRGVKTRG